MSFQVCHCGWSKMTSYQGLRTHQGKKGCTPRGTRIPETEQIFSTYFPQLTFVGPPMRVEDPLMTIFNPPYRTERDQSSWRVPEEDSDEDDCILVSSTTQNVLPNFPMIKSLQQQQPLQTNTKPNKSLPAPGFTTSQTSQMSEISSSQRSPEVNEVTVRLTNTMSETPTQFSKAHQTAGNARRALDFNSGAQQEQQTLFMPMSQISGPQVIPAFDDVTAKDKNKPQRDQSSRRYQEEDNDEEDCILVSSTTQTSQKPMQQIFGIQSIPASGEVTAKDKNKSVFETPTQFSTLYKTSGNALQSLCFTSGAQQTSQKPMQQIFGTQSIPAFGESTVTETNKPLFKTPPHDSRTHQTAANGHRAIDFSTGAQQTSLMPMQQISSNQARSTFSESTVKETNKLPFETPPHDSRTHQTAANGPLAFCFGSGVQQTSQTSQIFGNQASSTLSESFMKETNKLLFKTPPHDSRTHQTAANGHRAIEFSTGAQQVDQHLWDPPTTIAQETTVQPTEREKEMEREREKEMEKERAKEIEREKMEREKERAKEMEREKKRAEEWEAQRLQKVRTDRMTADLKQNIQSREQKMAEVISSVKACKADLDADWLEIDSVFSEVMRVVKDARQKALRPLEQRRHRVKTDGQHLVQKMQTEIDKLKKTIDELDRSPKLQDCPPTVVDEDWEHVSVVTAFSFGSLRTITSNMMDAIQQEVEHLSSVELKRIPTFAVDVKLDPSSAHRCLVLSRDGKMVRDGGTIHRVPDSQNKSQERFDMFGSVLGLNRLTSGKSYWEVEVSNKTGWDLGVARRNANRKGKLRLNPDNGYWVAVHYEGEKYAALTAPPVPLPLKENPQKVGVFVDYEEGLVSFYDVTARSHIYSFTECSFGDEIFPYFSPHLKENEKNADPLIISAVRRQ